MLQELSITDRTLIMGIVNVTPDSFSDRGRHFHPDDAVAQAKQLEKEGADILDLGAESTRPGAEPVPVEEELRRLTPVVERLVEQVSVPISIDTRKRPVAEEMLRLGADIINDVSALRYDLGMGGLLADLGCPVILMHMQGTPQTMQESPEYENVISDILEFFRERTEYAVSEGIRQDRIILDPGIGFGKTLEHNYQIIRHLDKFKSMGYPLVLGASRKSLIGTTLDLPVDERLEGSLAVAAVGIWKGADIVRVHDVQATKRVARMVDALRGDKKVPQV